MSAFASAAVVWLLALVSIASATDFQKCKIGTPPLNTTLGNCDKYPCNLVRGTNISGGVDFVYAKDLTVLKPELTVFVSGLPLKWPINQKDGCASLTLNKCPIKAGTRARFEYSLFLGPRTPLVQPLIRFELKNARGETIICSEIPAKIIPKKKFQLKMFESSD
ncbi:Hypothetical predicted protein [Cloeon dipterum]|uniref:MD-2-related lipid-recognition domain-containing protein n=1 Tax=Cloeon dipterum TaxID=197152 RepID=A0A8S1BWN8_9INSE|nr:Hypothetical predicted protein [Cloeon dipterum]